MNPFHAVLLNSFDGLLSQPKTFLSSSDVTPSSIYWCQVFKSSEWPEIPTIKPNFVLYGTVHANAQDGGIYWGQCDTPQGAGFVESGLIMLGNQAETPWLIRANGKLHLYHHVHRDYNLNGFLVQETRLWSTEGGLLHEDIWEMEGYPLGIYNDDDHTGYCRIHRKNDGVLVAHHLGRQNQNPSKAWVSYSTDEGLTFTRQYQIDTTTGVPSGRFGYSVICPFKYNGIKYGFYAYTSANNQKWVALGKLNEDLLPIEFLKNIIQYPGLSDLQMFKDDNIAYLNIKDSVEGGGKYEQFTYDIRNVA